MLCISFRSLIILTADVRSANSPSLERKHSHVKSPIQATSVTGFYHRQNRRRVSNFEHNQHVCVYHNEEKKAN